MVVKIFRKIVVLDNLILFPKHRKILTDLADEVIYYESSTPESLNEILLKKLKLSEMPQCPTQLGIQLFIEQELATRVNGADCVLTCWTGIPTSILGLNPQLEYIGFWTHDKYKIGMGRIGQKVAHIAKYGYGMNVRYFSRTRKHDIEAHNGYLFDDIDGIMVSDVITIHVSPDAPWHLIDKK